MLNEDSIFGWSCLKCRAVTQCAPKIIVPGDDTPTWLTLGQRETVFCPLCRDNKNAEFIEVTGRNANRVVDATGRPVMIPGLSSPSGAPAAAAAVGGVAYAPSQQMMPPPFFPMAQQQQPGGAQSPYSSPALMGDRDFEKHVAALSDDQVRALKQDLQLKLAVVDSALTERRRCIVCCEKDRSVVLLPCKHMLMCDECSKKVSTCPSCRQTIEDRISPFA